MKDFSNDIQKIRQDFPFFGYNKDAAYFDTGATALKPRTVIDSINDYNSKYSANIHRAVFDIGQRASSLYEKSRETVAGFLGADKREIIFTSGTTASINLFSESFAETFIKEGDRIIITEMEHHANILTWQRIAKKYKCELSYIPITKDGLLD